MQPFSGTSSTPSCWAAARRIYIKTPSHLVAGLFSPAPS